MKPFRSKSEKLRDAAYHNLVDTLSDRRKTVYNIIKTYRKITNPEIADKMVLNINEVTPRTNELQTMRLVKYAGGTDKTKSGLKNSQWSITTPEEREEMIKTDLIYYRNQISDLEDDLFNIESEYTTALVKKEIKRIENKLKLIK